jgi:hypothetical protein
MEIVKKDETVQVKLSDLRPGAVFSRASDQDIWLIRDETEAHISPDVLIHCIELETGGVYRLKPQTLVIERHGKFVED